MSSATPEAAVEPPAVHQLIGFVIVGKELRATVRTPTGDVYQGTVSNWQKVVAIEVPK